MLQPAGLGCGAVVMISFVNLVTFGDIWCLFVSFGPAPHIYQRGERVREPVCTIHGHYPDYTWSSVRQGREVPGTGPTRPAYT